MYTDYHVMEHFYTLQGEGYYTGQAAYFIRLAGCDVGCVWCDVKDSWEQSNHPKYTVETLQQLVKDSGARICVITGGEPCMYDLSALTDALHSIQVRVHIETSGTHPITGAIDWICLSPKKFKAPLPENLHLAHEFKPVIYHASDFDWAESFRPQLSDACKLYLQVEWSKSETLMPKLVDYIQQQPAWTLSLQTHKFIHIP